MKVLITAMFAFFLKGVAICQKVVINENFENDFRLHVNDLTTTRIFSMETYLPKQKLPVDLYSNSRESPFNEHYVDMPCNDSTKKNFYASMLAYDHEIENMRSFIFIKIDSTINGNLKYSLSFRSKLSPFSKFSIDSLGYILFKDEEEISIFFRRGYSDNKAKNINLSEVNDCEWTSLQSEVKGYTPFKYIMIGNLGFNNVVKRKKIEYRKNNNAIYFIDDIRLTQIKPSYP